MLRPPQGALPTRPQPEPQPTPPAAAKCIPVHGGDYYSAVVFDALGQNLAEVYREEDNFKNQWGLSHVNLLKGEDDKPGTGVTIGFLDSGIAADHCLAVLGEDIQLAYYGPAPDSHTTPGEAGFQGIGIGDGTSFATPMVAGGLAIMKQLFRDQLSNTELVARAPRNRRQ